MRRLIAASMRWIKMIEQGFREATPPRFALNRPRLSSAPRRTAGSKKNRLEPGVRVTRLSLDTRMVAFGRPFSCGLARPDRSPIRIDFACSSRLRRMAAFCALLPFSGAPSVVATCRWLLLMRTFVIECCPDIDSHKFRSSMDRHSGAQSDLPFRPVDCYEMRRPPHTFLIVLKISTSQLLRGRWPGEDYKQGERDNRGAHGRAFPRFCGSPTT